MQREREGVRDLFGMDDPFSVFKGFGGLGSGRSMTPSLFGGRDPFDDPFFTRPFGGSDPFDYPFFTRPFGGMSEPSMFNQITSSSNKVQNSKSNGIVIEELNSDHEGEKEDKVPGDSGTHSRSSKEPSVEHPDDDVDDWKNKDVNYKSQHSKSEGTEPQARSISIQTCKVTYGGVDGAYYTSTRTRRTGNDGVLLEESKEADKTSGQATHRISRGIHDKGHSFTRKLNSDGKVDTLRTLHNLDEDELVGFEEAWKGNANKQLPGWNDGFDLHRNAGSSRDEQKERASQGGWALPSTLQTRKAIIRDNEAGTTSASGGRTKKVVRINID